MTNGRSFRFLAVKGEGAVSPLAAVSMIQIVGGYFINGQLLGYSFNNSFSYDMNFNQRNILRARNTWAPWISQVIFRLQSFMGRNGNSVGNFSWQRRQLELMAGYHWSGPVRLLFYADTYNDAMLQIQGVNNSVYEGQQYRIHPV